MKGGEYISDILFISNTHYSNDISFCNFCKKSVKFSSLRTETNNNKCFGDTSTLLVSLNALFSESVFNIQFQLKPLNIISEHC